MVDKKITELTAYTPPIDTDVMPIVDVTTATTKKITMANVKTAVGTNRPFVGARAYLSADQDNIAGGGGNWYKIALNAESYDAGSNFDTSDNSFLVPTTGYYQVNATLYFEGADMSDYDYNVAIWVDPVGAGAIESRTLGSGMFAATAATDLALALSDILYLTAGDKVYLYSYIDDVDVDIQSGEDGTCMSIALLGV